MSGLSHTDLEVLLHWENALRTGAGKLTAETTAELPLPAYWRQVLLIFQAHQQIHADHPVTADITAALTPAHRWLLAARWPDLISSPDPVDPRS
jgi:thymidylate synthase